jgi:SAM-dependent methyltransferase
MGVLLTMDAPSPWVMRFAHLIPRGGSVLDVACGSGRHLRWLAAQGFVVTGVDRDASALAECSGVGERIEVDLESGDWPLGVRRFDAVVVTNYLWRANLPHVVSAVAPGGVLLYETFAVGNERYGRPSNPQFLLRPGELLDAVRTLHVLAYEDGLLDAPVQRVQRIAAIRPAPGAAEPGHQRLVA